MSDVRGQVRVHPPTGPTLGVALVLHGGRPDSLRRTRAWHLSVLRMSVFASALHRSLRGNGVAVWALRFGVRGWNGAAMSPTADVRWALGEITAQYGPVPVVLVGHSMGGRAAIHAAGQPGVIGVVGLAPWLPGDEPTEQVVGRRLFFIHGARDRWVPASLSLAYARRAARDAADVQRIELHGTGHPMLRRAGVWHGLAAFAAGDMLRRAEQSDSSRAPKYRAGGMHRLCV